MLACVYPGGEVTFIYICPYSRGCITSEDPIHLLRQLSCGKKMVGRTPLPRILNRCVGDRLSFDTWLICMANVCFRWTNFVEHASALDYGRRTVYGDGLNFPNFPTFGCPDTFISDHFHSIRFHLLQEVGNMTTGRVCYTNRP